MLESGKYSIYFLMGTSSHGHMWISCVLSFGTQSPCIEPMSDSLLMQQKRNYLYN